MKLHNYVWAYGVPKEDADAMRARSALCPQLTFTETYRDHYDSFAEIRPCN